MRYLAVDLGSTYTKLTAVDGADGTIKGTATAFTTITTDVMEGFTLALHRLREKTGGFRHDRLLCCSSAGGGLAMVAVGLVPELTAKAARMAAESAGAKVVGTYAYELSETELEEIYGLDPDIVLLSGGTDGGNKEIIIGNARLLATIERDFTIIVAGNKSAARELDAVLARSGKRYVITGNVMPSFGRLDIEPARAAVRDVFIERIIDAKGLARIQAMTEQAIVPTPLAVLMGCELLSLGTKKTPGLGEFLAVDLGGATTDVYSMAGGGPSLDNVLVKGLPEPYAKRSVEGDLGMRYSAAFLLDAVGNASIAEAACVAPDAVRAWVAACSANPDTIAPRDTLERRIDEALARQAIACAVERHCGVMEKIYTPLGETFTLTGKDLSTVRTVIGIGGALVNSERPEAILAGAAACPRTLATGRMLPRSPRYFLDSQYIFSAMGLVGMADPELALTVLKNEIQPLPEGNYGVTEHQTV